MASFPTSVWAPSVKSAGQTVRGERRHAGTRAANATPATPTHHGPKTPKRAPADAALRGGVDILVATPGRLLDLVQQNALSLKEVEILVLDEADRMLDMGFIHDMRRIIKCLPRLRQTLMFSATFAPAIRQLSQQFLNQHIHF